MWGSLAHQVVGDFGRPSIRDCWAVSVVTGRRSGGAGASGVVVSTTEVVSADRSHRVALSGSEVAVRFEPRKGKGSHGRLYFGERFTTVKDRRKEIGIGLQAAMLRQLELKREDMK